MKNCEEIIEQYKKVLRMDMVPELIIENPFIIDGVKENEAANDVDMEWAREAIDKHERHYGHKAAADGYKQYEMTIIVSTKEEGFSRDKMFLTIAKAIRGENENRYVLSKQK